MRIRCLKFLVAIMGFSLLSACAGISVRSQADPQLTGRAFHKVLVSVNFSGWGLRQDAERQFRTKLAKHKVEAVPSSEFFFPGRTYSAEEFGKMLADAHIEAVLIVAPTGTGMSTDWIPQTTMTPSTATSTGSATQRTLGGFYVHSPWGQFNASLYDPASGKIVWVAQVSSKENAFASWGDLARSMAKKMAAQLVKDRILK